MPAKKVAKRCHPRSKKLSLARRRRGVKPCSKMAKSGCGRAAECVYSRRRRSKRSKK